MYILEQRHWLGVETTNNAFNDIGLQAAVIVHIQVIGVQTVRNGRNMRSNPLNMLPRLLHIRVRAEWQQRPIQVQGLVRCCYANDEIYAADNDNNDDDDNLQCNARSAINIDNRRLRHSVRISAVN